ncbi:diiron oxygenase [Aciditerrimonas ferrireducens]|jgi:hypothetical protein|uniref:diiron oxygenase n=1 Tax=Aciditerrimonas ferrireducens TaxID=667306 RepID=UPI0020063904|nr:diiron oxygenase [Aciditerrimonas ferrireducens]MCK4177170.1 diiron oxygenase [Aciditerrimonas ferrireducens]
MPVEVAVPRQVAERLNVASVQRRWYPFEADVIDWSVPLDGSWAYVAAGHSIFSASGVLDRLAPEDRSFVERWEVTQTMRNVAHGEHLLNQGILALLWHVDPYDPSFRYLLHEVAEECQHMAMFNHWVRLNADIATRDMGEEQWAKTMAAFTMDLAVRLPEAFWVNVLLFEFVGDEANQATRSNPVGDDGRPLHPILVQMGVAHTSEEARHIAYARRWLEEGMARLGDDEVAEVQRLAELGAGMVVERRQFLPVRYSRQLAPYLSKEEFEAARQATPASKALLRQLRKLLAFFEEHRVVRAETVRRWEDAGAFE